MEFFDKDITLELIELCDFAFFNITSEGKGYTEVGCEVALSINFKESYSTENIGIYLNAKLENNTLSNFYFELDNFDHYIEMISPDVLELFKKEAIHQFSSFRNSFSFCKNIFDDFFTNKQFKNYSFVIEKEKYTDITKIYLENENKDELMSFYFDEEMYIINNIIISDPENALSMSFVSHDEYFKYSYEDFHPSLRLKLLFFK